MASQRLTVAFAIVSLLSVLTSLVLAASPAPGISPATGKAAPQAGKDYEQWTEAKRGTQATPASAIEAPAGFQVELLRSAEPGESSWVSMAIDPQDRIVIGKEGTHQGTERGILRLTLPNKPGDAARVETIDDSLQECRGLLFAFNSLYARCNKESPGRPSGLYRLRDTGGDDRFDEVKLLRAEKGGGHGVNDLTLGPDGRIYLVQGDESALPADWQACDCRLPRYGYDQLFGSLGTKDIPKFNRPPPGYLVRTDAEAKTWEVLAAGLRNPFGIDFNADGEAFTYEADMEWHVNLPWYRPTHLIHVVSGIDYGWRDGTNPWPLDCPDRPPINLSLDLGSPTAVKFGTRSHFPPKYRRALFILDWAYGRILAVHLKPRGASYECSQEDFLGGRPLNVTDMDFDRQGAMVFITGGRQTQSGLYRVSYVGPKIDETAATSHERRQLDDATAARALRRTLESFHGRQNIRAVDAAWPQLSSADPWLRAAARIAIESQGVESWQERVLAESDPAAATTALLALARTAPSALQPRLLARLGSIGFDTLSPEQKLTLLRAYQLAIIRGGKPQADALAAVVRTLAAAYPAGTANLDRELCQLLVYLGAPDVVEKTMPLIASPTTGQADKIYFLMLLRGARQGWTRQSTDGYFRALSALKRMRGGRQYGQYLKMIEEDALARLSAGQRLTIARMLAAAAPAPSTAAIPKRSFVREWTGGELLKELGRVDMGRDFARGEALFIAASCSQCHQIGNIGTLIGPDLTSVSRRFPRQDILRSIIEPSAAIDEKYRLITIRDDEGRVISGTILEENERQITVSPNPTTAETQSIAKSDIEERRLSPISPMPTGLLNTLTEDEILDLWAYVESGGDPDYRSFRRK